MAEKKPKLNEDWLAMWIGLGIFVISLGTLAGVDLLGWVAKTNVWLRPAAALVPLSKEYTVWLSKICSACPGVLSLLATYVFLLAVTTLGAAALRLKLGEFVRGFTLVFWISYLCWILGSYANIAATPDKLANLGISWSLNLTPEAGFIIALAAGLLIGNFLPRFAASMQAAIRPEWYIKTGIVLLGGYLVIQAAGQLGLLRDIIFRGLCAIVEAYLIYWALVYYIARKFFKFPREWAVPLASGISICGVSAAVATGAAIKARPVVPIMVSSLVVVFAVVELLILPFAAQYFLADEPMVAGAWMGLAVKSDGAAIASGEITDALICAKPRAADGRQYKEGTPQGTDATGKVYHYQQGLIVGTATTVKVFIDIFIGIWACILAIIWCTKIEGRSGDKLPLGQIWERFPKFVIGYVITFLAVLLIVWQLPGLTDKVKTAVSEATALRSVFFVMTFFTIGVMSNFKKLWEEGIGKLAAVYVVCLFGFIIWIGLLISWIFFHGIQPKIIGG